MTTQVLPSYSKALRNNPFEKYSLEELEQRFHLITSQQPQEGDYVQVINFTGLGEVQFVANEVQIEAAKALLATKHGSYYQGISRDAIALLRNTFKLTVEAYLDATAQDQDYVPSVCRSSVWRKAV